MALIIPEEIQMEIMNKRKNKIIKSNLIPNGICVNLFGTFWAKDISWIDKYVINHERVHTAQQKELLFIPFYVIYLVEWLIKLIKYKNWKNAYYNISFEREAYKYGKDLSYLQKRKLYSWIKYIKSSTALK